MWRTLIYVVASSIEGDLSFDSNLSYEAASYCQATSCYEEPLSGKSAYVDACLALFADTPTSNGSSLWPMVPHRHACGACDYFRVWFTCYDIDNIK